MASAEKTPFRMRLEKGRMSPASAFDAERLDTYRNGSEIYVTLYQGRNMKLHRKFFAIVGMAVKTCKTPWKTTDEAVNALKLALSVTDLGKTVTGKWFVTPRSLTDLDEPEFSAFYEQAMEVLYSVTGVDPETLKKQAPDTADNDDFDPVTGEIAPDPVSETAPISTAAAEGDDVPHPPASSPSQSPTEAHTLDLSDEDKAWLKTVAKMLWAATFNGKDTDVYLDLLNNQRKGVETPDGISQLARDKAGSIYRRCKDFVMSEIDGKKAINLICGLSGLEETDLEQK